VLIRIDHRAKRLHYKAFILPYSGLHDQLSVFGAHALSAHGLDSRAQ
jgi:hypothetical protein